MDIAIIDVETENRTFDIMKGNKRIISIQLIHFNNEYFFYADAVTKKETLNYFCELANELLAKDTVFIAYNVNFDLLMIRSFLNLDIQEKNFLDIAETSAVRRLRSELNRFVALEEVCSKYGIDVSHKEIMKERARIWLEKHPEYEVECNKEADKLVREKDWSFDYALHKSREKISIGNAIIHNMLHILKTRNKGADFYKYAMGDVRSEYQLYKAIEASGGL